MPGRRDVPREVEDERWKFTSRRDGTPLRLRRDVCASGERTAIRLSDQVRDIETREDLAAFITALRCDLLDRPAAWENPTLERYLESLAAWTEDMDGYFAFWGEAMPSNPSWRLVGEMLIAAQMYE